MVIQRAQKKNEEWSLQVEGNSPPPRQTKMQDAQNGSQKNYVSKPSGKSRLEETNGVVDPGLTALTSQDFLSGRICDIIFSYLTLPYFFWAGLQFLPYLEMNSFSQE